MQLGSLGTRLRELRTAKGITLAQLSASSQVSVAMLSHIERGQAAPSLKTLERLRIALDVQLANFFVQADAEPESIDSSLIVGKQEDRTRLPFKHMGLVKELLVPTGHSDLEMLMLIIQPGGSSGPEPWTRNGEKAGYVIEGRFELTVGESQRTIETGDSFRFDGSIPHQFRNPTEHPTRVIWIIKSSVPG